MENAEHFVHRIADWNSVLELVESLRFFRSGNFDLHIAKRNGKELVVELVDHDKQFVARANNKLPIKIGVGLHDLYW